MRRAYVSGALTGVEGIQHRADYEWAATVLGGLGFEVYLPHLTTDPVTHAGIAPGDVYRIDRSQVTSADLVVAFVSVPSIGVGMELEIAAASLVPIVLVTRAGRQVSRMARGLPARLFGPVVYEGHGDLGRVLANAVEWAMSLGVRRRQALPDLRQTLSDLRAVHGVSREGLAHAAGLAPQQVEALETLNPRASNPSVAMLAAISDAADVPIEYLLSRSREMTSSRTGVAEVRDGLATFSALEKLDEQDHAGGAQQLTLLER